MEFSEYYIAYFDVLGSKSFFKGDEDAALIFLKQDTPLLIQGLTNNSRL